MSKHSSHEKKHEGEHISHENKEKIQDEPEKVKNEESAQKKEAKEKNDDDPAVKIAALEAEVNDLKDQYLRKAAEFENFRKRMNREKQEAIDFANQSLLLDLIPVIDDFERAIKSGETSKDFDGFHEGVSMIEKRLVSQLENKWGLKRYESANQPFDPEIHEAIMMDKSDEVSEPMVAEDFLKGYKLKERVIRSAKVKVLMPADDGTKNEDAGNPAQDASSPEPKPESK